MSDLMLFSIDDRAYYFYEVIPTTEELKKRYLELNSVLLKKAVAFACCEPKWTSLRLGFETEFATFLRNSEDVVEMIKR